MRKILTFCVVLLLVIISGCSSADSYLSGSDKLLDSWDEAPRLFGTADKGGSIAHDLNMRGRIGYTTDVFKVDTTKFTTGDFSILYQPVKDGSKPVFGFVSCLWGGSWQLEEDMSLKFSLKTSGSHIGQSWNITFIDGSGRTGEIKAENMDTSRQWKEVSLPLSSFNTAANFDWQDVRRAQIEADFSDDAKIWLDGIRFESEGGEIIGVTDKPLKQWKKEAEVSRQRRIDLAMSLAARRDHFEIVSAFAKMYQNQELEEANKILINDLENSTADTWSLLHTPIYLRFYYFFSSRNGKYPGRMSEEAEKLLLETLWQRTKYKNDIHWSRKSTWWMDGSENHDLNGKVCNLVSSRIFMDEPDYKDRVYPNLGFGGSYHYGRAGYYGKDMQDTERHGGGRADLSDGKQYTAKDQYKAWLEFLKEYFRERARRGFFLECASASYTKHTFNFVELAYSLGGDDELKQIIGKFMDLFWADYAQQSFGTNRGGPKTRHHRNVGRATDGTYGLINFHLGGPGNGACWWYYNILNDYRMPDVVWAMMLDRQGMGSFEYKSRGIGEEENIWPRPLGTERTLLCDTDSRFLKYSYVTPDYVLGTQMDHPAAIHSHLSMAGRWHGMIFAQSDAARIVPIGLPAKDEQGDRKGAVDMEVMYHTAQYKNTLVVMQSRRWLAIEPTWYPSYPDRYEKPIGVWFGTDWDRLEEKDGWIFVQRGNAYAAVRVVLWDEEYEKQKRAGGEGTQVHFHGAKDDPTVKLRTDCYKWNQDRTWIELEDIFSPIVIEAARKEDYPTMDDFMKSVLAAPIELYKTVVPGFDILVYTSPADDAPEIVFNAANNDIPTFGGEYVDYSYPMTYHSPWLKSEYRSGKIDMSFGGYELKLDFN